jgi:hypothetical protein
MEEHNDKETKSHEHEAHHEHEKKEEHHEHKEEHHGHKKTKLKKITMWQTATAILGILLIASVFTAGFGIKKGTGTSGESLTIEEASDKAITYINTNLLQPGTSAKLVSSEEKSDLYNIKMDIGGREFDSYVTKDGGLLFPSVVDLSEEVEAPSTETQQQPPAPDVEKSDKPNVELFVMSHCPFGTQAEKGIIPVAELLGDKIDFEIKFVNYAMHGEKEVVEQTNQHCIKTEEPDKFLPYLKCFLKEGDGAACLEETEIDEAKLEACYEATDTEFKITESLEDQSTWSGGRFPLFLINDAECKEYGVRGSPSLVLNGKSVSSARSPAAFLSTICSAFSEPPPECEQQLDSANPSPGFGFTTTGSTVGSAAQCE